jgi:hypothetical protein
MGNNPFAQTVSHPKPKTQDANFTACPKDRRYFYLQVKEESTMPTTEKLKQEIADAEKKLAQERSRLQRLENRKSYYEKGDRQKRAHRLITRGAAVESITPLARALSETEFYAFAEKIFALPEVRALLMEAVNAHNEASQKGKG